MGIYIYVYAQNITVSPTHRECPTEVKHPYFPAAAAGPCWRRAPAPRATRPSMPSQRKPSKSRATLGRFTSSRPTSMATTTTGFCPMSSGNAMEMWSCTNAPLDGPGVGQAFGGHRWTFASLWIHRVCWRWQVRIRSFVGTDKKLS